MALRVKIEPLDSWVSFTIDEAMSPKARSHAVAAFAREQLVETLASNTAPLGSDTPYEQFVNGRKGAALETAHPDRGTIIFEFELINDVLTWIMATLIERSPRGPAGGAGTYRDSHIVFADGKQIAVGGIPPAAEEYAFTNLVPYSRKLEIGQTKSGRDFLVSVPNRIYQRTAKDARARFGNIANIGFTYRAIIGGSQIDQAKTATRRFRHHNRAAADAAHAALNGAHNKSSIRFPTITVRTN